MLLIAVTILPAAPDICDESVSEQVEFVIVGNVSQDDVNLVKSILDSVPYSHLHVGQCAVALRRVTLVEGKDLRKLPNSDVLFANHPGYSAAQAGGVTDLVNGNVYLAVDGDLESVTWHEIGHIVFDGPATAILGNMLIGQELARLYAAGDASMGSYSRKNVLEFKAEAYEHYMLGKSYSPGVGAVLDRFMELR